MNKTKDFVSSEELVQMIVDQMQNKKAKDISILDLREIDTAIADFFVICTATSFTHLESIAEEIMIGLEPVGEKPKMNEHKSNQQWLVLDYFSVVVHLFLEEHRQKYGLEELWGDAKITSLQNS